MSEALEEFLLDKAHKLALQALELREVPIGCVVYDVGLARIVARGRNATNAKGNGTRHAELEALDQLDAEFGPDIKPRTANLILAVTVEPCIMCAHILRSLRFRRVYFGARNERFGGCGSVLAAHDRPYPGLPPMDVLQVPQHVARNVNLLRRFYLLENERAPEPKRSSKRQRVFKEFPND
jgi:tRNA-specific adenosine deaminase 2